MTDTDTIEDAAAMLTEHAITAAPVLDKAGTVVGIVSEADLLWRRVPGYPSSHPDRVTREVPPRPKTVAEVMSARTLTTTPLADLADVAHDMIHHDVRSLPVLDSHGGLVGILSRRDIVRSVVRTDEALAQEIQHRLDAYAGTVGRWRVSVTDAAATIDGRFDNETERIIVGVMARAVPGIAAVRLSEPEADRSAHDVSHEAP